MTEREARIRRAIKLVETAFPSGAGPWPKARFEVWVDSVVDLEVMAIERAAVDLVREWTGGRAPVPGVLRERVLSHVRRLDAEQSRSERQREIETYEPAPAWWARLVCGALIVSCESRGQVTAVPPRTVPYLEIARRHELRPDDLVSDSPTHGERRVKRAIAEAKEYGESTDPGPSGHEHLGELIGGGVSTRGSTE